MWKKLFSLDKKVLVIVFLFVGIVGTVAAAETLSYTDSAQFCSNCHIMNEAHDSFAASTHANIACNDCHLPHDNVVNKLVFKAKAGMTHVYFNTLGSKKIPKVLHATTASKDVINKNCISCHEATIQNVSHDAKENCFSCHRDVPHGKATFKTKEFDEQLPSGTLLNRKGGF
ncbi:nitrate/TMAO reductase membrane-bound tetraheme cytochrome C subunit [Anoxybacillus gonensis]|uniref:NapC/NirT family cytochrome c n=1 Tax=Anoxybacillus gonensis TaxID=198467 RepID=A0AAW7TDL1_9BACL|nr:MULTISPECIES: NapC/NirT family cytochrome c [Anoxybacillus]AXM89942.1 nitrate reductase [Anoxybacillus ayderensis G10]THD17304.1 nitrate reductase [Anoxybacillus ayderensis]AKS38810.1 nitrate/TMAO reductase membrane-bound tetraheme cytochrome C subunit [Anoxybacillus gonensis]KGP60083.1 nitrate/TMAO reductase membrane-bound tetraheme cytochrome C subunit [Anoxybacillus gonensis]MBW9218036.1 NapC/NirT family cytochrome c [Anoxybacillus sp. ST70]